MYVAFRFLRFPSECKFPIDQPTHTPPVWEESNRVHRQMMQRTQCPGINLQSDAADRGINPLFGKCQNGSESELRTSLVGVGGSWGMSSSRKKIGSRIEWTGK